MRIWRSRHGHRCHHFGVRGWDLRKASLTIGVVKHLLQSQLENSYSGRQPRAPAYILPFFRALVVLRRRAIYVRQAGGLSPHASGSSPSLVTEL
jgi:hypothetical protein